MPIVFFSDIDDSLIQTKRKCLDEPVLTTTAVDKEGLAASFSTPAQQLLINLCNEHIFIPVTGRNKAALDRVSIAHSSFQVIDHGAIVLNAQGELDKGWLNILADQTAQWRPVLTDYVDQVQQVISEQKLALRCRIISDFGIACYISIKGEQADLTKLAQISERFSTLDENARVHINGDNMALLPPYACKKSAVNYLKQHFLADNQQTLFVGIGDSDSDLAFMQACHFQMIPQKSQISEGRLA
ncbi:MAG: hydroxymethylpyrimidine pyrophosphatase-like HAD family hydrolase [Oceanospirillaceae bacterium]|jgi:hydroxymethylpyrimidine pyrophosphatase-like HAD family hydrolase